MNVEIVHLELYRHSLNEVKSLFSIEISYVNAAARIRSSHIYLEKLHSRNVVK
jgi:hypothetical protein